MTLLIILAAGLLLGYFLIPKSWKKVNGLLQSAAMILTLFFMGVSLGMQPDLLSDLREVGIVSVLVALAAVAGSILAVYFVERRFFRPKKRTEQPERKEGSAE